MLKQICEGNAMLVSFEMSWACCDVKMLEKFKELSAVFLGALAKSRECELGLDGSTIT